MAIVLRTIPIFSREFTVLAVAMATAPSLPTSADYSHLSTRYCSSGPPQPAPSTGEERQGSRARIWSGYVWDSSQ